jgi:4-hydroxy-tetrahydrodipicolinate synthase
LIARTCALVNRRVTVLVGITATVWSESQYLAEAADKAGASAAVLAPPYYFPMTQDELLGYVEFVSKRVPLPLLLYNIPQMTKTAFDVSTVAQLMEHENILGIKDSSGNFEFFRALLEIGRRRADWRVLMGEESLLAEALLAGAHGGIPGGANLAPKFFTELYRAARCGDRRTVNQLQDHVLLLRRIYEVESSAAAVLRAAKAGLSLMGLCNDFVAPPFFRYRDEQRDEIGRLLHAFAPVAHAIP